MRLRELTPMIWTKQLKETAEFYTTILDFKLDDLSEEYGWGHLSKEGVQLMFSLPPRDVELTTPNFTGSFYVYVNGIDELWERIKDKVKVSYPIENFQYGMREFAIYDNNGYMIQFGQETSE